MVDAGFTRRGRQSQTAGRKSFGGHFFLENCTRMGEILSREGGAGGCRRAGGGQGSESAASY